jgi:E3 ubiquitin-protein ligase HUWE1
VTPSIERTAQGTLHTVLFDSFYRKGGLDAIVVICRNFMRTIIEHSQTRADDRTETANQALGHAYSGIKVALHLLLSLISSKAIFESSQTILLFTRDKKDTDPDYFEPHNFLVKTRLAVLPLVRELWEAPWLVSSPQSLIKSVVQVVLEILNGEGEESPDVTPHPPPGASSLSMGGPSLFRVTLADENRVRQLTDMGFPRSGAEHALIRTHNNVNAATELLLSNPFRFQSDPELLPPQPQEPGESDDPAGDTPATPPDAPPSGSPPAQDDAAISGQGAPVLPPAQDDPATSSQGAPGSPPAQDHLATSGQGDGDSQNVEADTRPPGKSTEEWRNELNSMREPLKSDVGRLALRLVDEHPELIFDVHNAFVGRADGYRRSSVRLLVDDIQAFTTSSQDSREEPLAVRCRLLALVLNEAPASFASIVTGDEQAFMEVVLTLLLSIPIDSVATQQTIPKWLAALMLVAEALLSLSEDPRTITLPKEGEPIVDQEILTGPLYDEAKTVLFDFSLRLLALAGLPRDELLASLRLLVFMTRDHDLAMQFVKSDGVSLLFKSLKSGGVAGSQSYISIILRHIVEDPAVVRLIMREEVQRFLSHPRTRTGDAASYVRACNTMALRDPKAFIDVTKSLAQLERPFAYLSQIVPNDSGHQEDGLSPGETGKDIKNPTTSQAEVTAHTLPSPPEYLEAVVHFLIGELMASVRSTPPQSGGVSNPESTSPDTPVEGNVKQQAQPERKSPNEAQDPKPDHYYSGFLMQTLTELMFSYDACKTAFISYSPHKHSSAPSTSKDAAKARLAALHFVLSDLITFRTIEPDPSIDARNNVPLCNWAMSLVVALCVDTSSSQPNKDVSPELIAVRKTVLEAVSRAIKDSSPPESLDARYGRLLALADLCYRLLTVRFSPGLRKPHEETPTHIAKIMLEKNFVSTLTNALAEVDLNYPNVRVVVAAMLKPLELL